MDYKEISLIINKVNLNICFGKDFFIQILKRVFCLKIKILSNEFAGIIINLFVKLESEGIDEQKYFDG